jgi:hypothetical protein
MADDPGNVKVVVRCRAFVRRGVSLKHALHRLLADLSRERKGHPLSHPHGPSNTEDDAIRTSRR